MKPVFKFLLEWIISIIFLCFSLILLGTLENVIIDLNGNLYILVTFVIANLIIIYILFHNWFAPRFKWLFSYKHKLSRQISFRLTFVAGLLLLVVYMFPYIHP